MSGAPRPACGEAPDPATLPRMDRVVAYVVDPDEPRAPPHAVWEQMSPAEQERIVESLPVQVPAATRPPEGDPHREAKHDVLEALGSFFRRVGRKVYLSSSLAVYYPARPCVVPDVLAVVDAEPHPRTKWVVDKERKGVDFALEIHIVGDAQATHERNLAQYAALGIREYFVFDRGRLGLRGFRLAGASRVYEPILPQGGRFASDVLGLDLTVHHGKLRFFHGTAPLLESEELVVQLESMLDEAVNEKLELERRIEPLRKICEKERDRADRAERALAKLRGEMARLKGEA